MSRRNIELNRFRYYVEETNLFENNDIDALVQYWSLISKTHYNCNVTSTINVGGMFNDFK